MNDFELTKLDKLFGELHSDLERLQEVSNNLRETIKELDINRKERYNYVKRTD